MGLSLDRVVPWGRSLAEYIAMFGLTEADLGRRILGCGDGPAAFNRGWTQAGGWVVSVDPLYQWAASEIRDRIHATYGDIIHQVRQHPSAFVWHVIRSPEELGQRRMAAMTQFLEDFEAGKAAGRYLSASLPNLPLADDSFDLALCSHFLFLYSTQNDLDFHLAAIQEMLRIAPEVRIFPLVDLASQPSRHLGPVMAALGQAGHVLQIETTAYEFQKGGYQRLSIRRRGSR